MQPTRQGGILHPHQPREPAALIPLWSYAARISARWAIERRTRPRASARSNANRPFVDVITHSL